MALETGTYINSLNASNPASTDGVAQADDHIRLVKATVKATLPNVTGAITATQAELNLMDGVTATTDELNTLDGITSTVAELNLLDGVTATTAELNYVDGVTSNVQTQLDTKVTAVIAGDGLAGGGISNGVTVTHGATSSQASVDNSGSTFIQDVTLDTYGHVTGLTSVEVSVSGAPDAVFVDRVVATGSQNLSGSNWTKTDLTNTVRNTVTNCTLSSSVISLPAGSYYVEFNLPIGRVSSDTAQKVVTRFRNTSTSTTAALGQTLSIGDWQNLNFHGCGEFTITGTNNFELQGWSEESCKTRYGYSNNSGEAMIFGMVKIWKL